MYLPPLICDSERGAGLSAEVLFHLRLEGGDGLVKGGLLFLSEIGDGHAGGLEFLQNLGLLFLQHVPAPLTGLGGTLLKELLRLGLQALPDLRISHEQS